MFGLNEKGMPIEEQDWKPRTLQALQSIGIVFMEDLQNVTAGEIYAKRNIGTTTLRDIRKGLACHGLKLKGDVIFDSEAEKKLILDMPIHIREMRNDLRQIERNVGFLCRKLDELHCNMQPIG